jgi:hypothetical protein
MKILRKPSPVNSAILYRQPIEQGVREIDLTIIPIAIKLVFNPEVTCELKVEWSAALTLV